VTRLDRVQSVAPEGPKRWDLIITSAYTSQSIPQLLVRSTAAHDVTPPFLRASSTPAEVAARLRGAQTAVYKLDVETASDQLTADATLGKPTTTTLIVRNAGP
jgi:hypothetical protein